MYKTLSILFFLSFFIYACNNPVEHDTIESKLQVSFQNNSGYELKNFTVSDRIIGNIKSNSTTNYFAFDTFRFDSGRPDEDASAEIDGRQVSNHYRSYWCGTEKLKADSGKYLVEINVQDTILILYCKNAPTIIYP